MHDISSSLLQQTHDESNNDERDTLLEPTPLPDNEAMISMTVFRLYRESFAFLTKCLVQVLEMKPIHTLPYFKNNAVLGVTNCKGQMKCCLDLKKILRVEFKEEALHEIPVKDHPRLLSIEDARDIWIFPVDEVYGIYSCKADSIQIPPVNILKSTNLLKGVVQWREFTTVGLIDEELLFYTIRRMI